MNIFKWSLPQILIDFLIILAVGLPTPLIKKTKSIFWSGFFCNDTTIQNPVIKPADFIENQLFHPIGWLFSFTLILLVEFVRQQSEPERIFLGKFQVPTWVYNAYCVLLSFTFGLLSTILVTTVLKGTIGRLRPTFMVDCLPNVNCSLPANHHLYHVQYECTNENFNQNNRLSFPSGHSSFSMYCALFLAIYIHKRLNLRVSKLIKSGIQMCLLFLTFYVGFSRVQNFRHFWDDVVGGFLLGAADCIIVSLNLYADFNYLRFLQQFPGAQRI